MRTRRPHPVTTVLTLLMAAAALPAAAEESPIPELDGVTIVEHLGDTLDTSLQFVDHAGARVALADFLDGERPVLLTLNYYRCTMLCNLQLNALVRGLKALEWAPGENFRAVTVSIDPTDSAEVAEGKRASYLEELGRGDVDWTFLTGEEPQIRALAASVGFGYRYIEEEDQYAHAPAVFFLSPDGKVARYLYGLEYPARDLKFAIMEAAEGRVGSPVDKIILSCFHYDASLGAYGPFAFGIMRLGGSLTIVLLGAFLGIYWRRERAADRAEDHLS
jgi:protein SCO1/2